MLDHPPVLSHGDVLNMLLNAVALVALVIVMLQLRQNKKLTRATLFKDLYSTFFNDGEIRDAFYQLAYGSYHFDDTFRNSQAEKQLDRLLSFLDLLCYLHEQGQISKNEMVFFRTQIVEVCRSANFKDYFAFIQKKSAGLHGSVPPYHSLLAYCGREEAG